MLSLLRALYELLSFITEDTQAWNLQPQIPENLKKKLNDACNELGKYLDEIG